VLRYLWPAPWSLFGLALGAAMLAAGGRVRRVQGALEFSGGALARLPGATTAITFGHVILGRSAAGLDALRAHEQVHVRQYERWGPFFVPAYLAEGAWQWLHGRQAYRDNRFEVEARQEPKANPIQLPATEPAPPGRRRTAPLGGSER